MSQLVLELPGSKVAWGYTWIQVKRQKPEGLYRRAIYRLAFYLLWLEAAQVFQLNCLVSVLRTKTYVRRFPRTSGTDYGATCVVNFVCIVRAPRGEYACKAFFNRRKGSKGKAKGCNRKK